MDVITKLENLLNHTDKLDKILKQNLVLHRQGNHIMAKTDKLTAQVAELKEAFGTFASDVDAAVARLEDAQTANDQASVDSAVADLKALTDSVKVKDEAVKVVDSPVAEPTPTSPVESQTSTDEGTVDTTVPTTATL